MSSVPCDTPICQGSRETLCLGDEKAFLMRVDQYRSCYTIHQGLLGAGLSIPDFTPAVGGGQGVVGGGGGRKRHPDLGTGTVSHPRVSPGQIFGRRGVPRD